MAVFAALILVGCSGNDAADAGQDTYTCPMHPTVVSDRPAACPVCGMDLVRKARPGEEVKITGDIARLIQSPNEAIVSASMHTVQGKYQSMPVSIAARGVVTYDTRRIYTIPTRIAGRLEKVYLQYPYQSVTKGQKIAEIYSPELVTAQRELIFLLENDSGNEALINSATRKLERMGMTSGQLQTLKEKRTINRTFSVYSAHSGYVVPHTQSAVAGQMGDGMSLKPVDGSENRLVKTGDYVAVGETLFNVADPSSLRIELNVGSNQVGLIKEGSEITLAFVGGKSRSATVDFVQPFFNEGESFVKIRVYMSDTEGLRIGQLVNAQIRLDSDEALWIPKEAVLDLGGRRIVFVKERGVFKPREVQTGLRSNGMLAIRGGIASSDEIAANGQFLVDSEGFINP